MKYSNKSLMGIVRNILNQHGIDDINTAQQLVKAFTEWRDGRR